ncbi:MAG: zinc-binding dehydrogenase [Chloroflexaceae bacterium]|nr:zinc-binding dehydrogenase [Chloroflexaceae bacterium]
MQAVVTDPQATGHVSLQTIDDPVAAANMALVRVSSFSLNLGEVRGASGGTAGRQIGWDLAGTVEQAAADGSGPAVGTRVVGFVPTGAWAEKVAVPTNALAVLPDAVSFAQAATLPVAGLTALYALEHGTRLLGRKVLVTGASGGVGLFACQLARLMGATVVGIIRRESYRALVETAGAHHVVISEDGAAARPLGPYRLVVESVGGQVLANATGMLEPDGVCVLFGGSASAEVSFNIWPFVGAGRAQLYGLVLFHELVYEPASVGLARLVGLVADGRLQPQITLEDSWEQVGSVAQHLLDRKIAAKAVLHIA